MKVISNGCVDKIKHPARKKCKLSVIVYLTRIYLGGGNTVNVSHNRYSRKAGVRKGILIFNKKNFLLNKLKKQNTIILVIR